jgi:thiol-disulfide isomerase/thioredoxin
MAPDAVFDSLEGKKVSFSSFRGKVVLLNFWATWCMPCRAEIPTFNAIQKDYDARGVKVIGLLAYDADADLANFDIKQDYTVLKGSDDEVAKFGVPRTLPITLVVDRDGRIQKRLRGAQTREVFEAAFKPLLGGDSPAKP